MTETYVPSIEEVKEQADNLEKYLIHVINLYINDKITDRRAMVEALYRVCRIAFTHQTPLVLEDQLKEIEHFSTQLKEYSIWNGHQKEATDGTQELTMKAPLLDS